MTPDPRTPIEKRRDAVAERLEAIMEGKRSKPPKSFKDWVKGRESVLAERIARHGPPK